jgi:hypothetical protein
MLAAMAIFTCSAAIAPEAEKLSVYEAIGGRAAVVAAVDRFYGRLLDDHVLGPFFPGGVGVRYRAYVVTIPVALGGPERYRAIWSVPTVGWASATPIVTLPPPTWAPP